MGFNPLNLILVYPYFIILDSSPSFNNHILYLITCCSYCYNKFTKQATSQQNNNVYCVHIVHCYSYTEVNKVLFIPKCNTNSKLVKNHISTQLEIAHVLVTWRQRCTILARILLLENQDSKCKEQNWLNSSKFGQNALNQLQQLCLK